MTESNDSVTSKASLNKLFKFNNEKILLIQNAVSRMNQITVEAYHLLHLHIRRLLEENQIIPDITTTWLSQFFYFVSISTKKDQWKKDANIQSTYNKLYKPLIQDHLIPKRNNLSDCITYEVIQMLTCIKNNIQIHFVKRQFKYLKSKYPDKEKKDIWKELNEINQKSNWSPNEDYMPTYINISVPYDLEANPFKFLEPMYRMNLYLESKEEKLFSLLPIRKGFIPKSLRLTTRSLKEILKHKSISKDIIISDTVLLVLTRYCEANPNLKSLRYSTKFFPVRFFINLLKDAEDIPT